MNSLIQFFINKTYFNQKVCKRLLQIKLPTKIKQFKILMMFRKQIR